LDVADAGAMVQSIYWLALDELVTFFIRVSTWTFETSYVRLIEKKVKNGFLRRSSNDVRT